MHAVLAWNGIKEKFSAGIAYIKGLVGQFRAVGSAIIDGLVNGIKSKIAAAWDAIVGLGQTIKSTITGALGIKSPSTVFANIGLMLGAGLVKGIGQGAPAVSHAMKQMATPPAVRFPPASDGSTGWQINPGRSRRTESAGGSPMSSGSTIVNLTQTFHIKGDAKDPSGLTCKTLKTSSSSRSCCGDPIEDQSKRPS